MNTISILPSSNPFSPDYIEDAHEDFSDVWQGTESTSAPTPLSWIEKAYQLTETGSFSEIFKDALAQCCQILSKNVNSNRETGFIASDYFLERTGDLCSALNSASQKMIEENKEEEYLMLEVLQKHLPLQQGFSVNKTARTKEVKINFYGLDGPLKKSAHERFIQLFIEIATRLKELARKQTELAF